MAFKASPSSPANWPTLTTSSACAVSVASGCRSRRITTFAIQTLIATSRSVISSSMARARSRPAQRTSSTCIRFQKPCPGPTKWFRFERTNTSVTHCCGDFRPAQNSTCARITTSSWGTTRSTVPTHGTGVTSSATKSSASRFSFTGRLGARRSRARSAQAGSGGRIVENSAQQSCRF